LQKSVFFYGSGHWSQKYLDTINSKFSLKIKIICIITNNSNFYYKSIPTIKNTNFAISKYGVPDGFIICTNPTKNLQILHEVLKFNKSIIIEKPICFPEDLNNFLDFLKKKYENKIFVNHFHFYIEEIKNYLNFVKKKTDFEIKIIDGNTGPIRSFSPITDWGPHAFGIISFLVDSLADLKINKFKVLKYDNKNCLNIYILFLDRKKNNLYKVLIGNNFNKKKRSIMFNFENRKKLFEIGTHDNLEISPLENLIESFFKSMTSSKKNNFDINTFKIGIDSIKLCKMVNEHLL